MATDNQPVAASLPLAAGPGCTGPELPLHRKQELHEDYTPERIAEYLLNNAVSVEDYCWAREEARRLGVDPDKIPHEPPAGV